MMELASALGLLYEYGRIPLLLLIILYLVRVLMDEDQSSIWRARIYYIVYSISGKREAEKKYIANDINGRVNLARRAIHHGQAILPRAVAVEWVVDNPEGVYDIAEGEFIVRLDPSATQERNISKLAMAVTGRTTLLGIRHLVERPLQQAIDLNIVKDVLMEVGDRKVLDWFYQQEYLPATQEEAVKNWNKEVVEIDERGLFTRMLLVELDAFSKRVAGLTPRPYMTGELEQLVHFIFRIATKELGQDVPLNFEKAHIAVGVILVAKSSKLLQIGIKPYLICMNWKVERECDAVYVITFDKHSLRETDEAAHNKFVRLTQELDKEILNSSLITKDFSVPYSYMDQDGKKRKGNCTRYLIKRAVEA
jgi:succinate dehydrogenase flavin-adding protein (antitoxin of CptAB toxin-antitoxin module)